MSRDQNGPEFILAKSDQEAEIGGGGGHKCQGLNWPGIDVAKGQNRQNLKVPEEEVTRARSGQVPNEGS